jgi:hypothetical protein
MALSLRLLRMQRDALGYRGAPAYPYYYKVSFKIDVNPLPIVPTHVPYYSKVESAKAFRTIPHAHRILWAP